MTSRKYKILLIAMVPLLIATVNTTFAQCPDPNPPESCITNANAYTISIYRIEGRFPYIVTDAADPNIADYPELDGVPPPYALWVYNVTGNLSKVSHFEQFIEYDCNQPINIIAAPANYYFADPCAGSDATKYGYGICNGRVLTLNWQPTDPPVRIWYATDVQSIGPTTVAVDTGRSLYACEVDSGGIRGPGFLPSLYAPADVESRVESPEYGGCMILKKHPVSGCIKEVWTCGDFGPPQRIPPGDPPGWITADVLDAGSLDNPRCREAVILKKGSILQQWVYYGVWVCAWEYCRSPSYYGACFTCPSCP